MVRKSVGCGCGFAFFVLILGAILVIYLSGQMFNLGEEIINETKPASVLVIPDEQVNGINGLDGINCGKIISIQTQNNYVALETEVNGEPVMILFEGLFPLEDYDKYGIVAKGTTSDELFEIGKNMVEVIFAETVYIYNLSAAETIEYSENNELLTT